MDEILPGKIIEVDDPSKVVVSPELDKLVAEITPENLNKTYLDELDGEDDPVGGLAYTPDYIESDIPQVVPKENAEIRLERLEAAFARLLEQIKAHDLRAQHRILG